VSDLPAVLGASLRQAGLEPNRQTPVPILNASYNENTFGFWAARLFRAFVVGRNGVTDEEAEAWLQEFDALEAKGAFFLCSTPILTEAVRIRAD
jgi:arsenite methyltransferase